MGNEGGWSQTAIDDQNVFQGLDITKIKLHMYVDIVWYIQQYTCHLLLWNGTYLGLCYALWSFLLFELTASRIHSVHETSNPDLEARTKRGKLSLFLVIIWFLTLRCVDIGTANTFFRWVLQQIDGFVSALCIMLGPNAWKHLLQFLTRCLKVYT